MEETIKNEEEVPSKKQKVEEEQLPPRLSFPRIGKRWGPSYEYPYPEATFKELVCLLKRGGSLDTFLGSEYAICSLIIKAVLENQIKEVSIFFPNRYSRNQITKRLGKAIQCLFQSLGDYSAKCDDFTRIGEIEITKMNEEQMTMQTGFICNFVVCSKSLMRGANGGEFNIIAGDLSVFDAKIVQKVLMPWIKISNDDIFQSQCIKDDEATAKRGKGLCVGGKSFTLKLDQLSKTPFVCDPTCRSCMVAHETWEQERENKEKAKLKLEKKFEALKQKNPYASWVTTSSQLEKLTEKSAEKK